MRAALALPALLVALPMALAAPAALAQGMPRAPQQVVPQQGPAPALPGLAARRAPAPIAGDPSAVLSPNAALFDAIARGDLAAARDAVGRGANIEARNALGLTPLDAAVDQGRHEIAFYLLSARDLAGTPAPVATPAPGSLSGPPAGTAPRSTPAPSRAAQSAAASLAGASGRAAAPSTAPLWAGNGGAPQPAIGFLGFDAGRPPGATPPAAARARPGRG